MNYSAVIFDMDGLILDTEILYRKAWQKAAKDCGFALSDDGHAQLLGRGRKGALLKISELAGSEFNKERFAEHLPTIEEEVFNSHPLTVKKGLLELLDFLDARKIKKAVATSSIKEKADFRLGICNLKHRFDVIVGGDEIPHSKPEPDIYLLTAERLKEMPKDCLVLEDAESGAIAGTKAGMDVIMVPDLKQPSQEIRNACRAVFASLLEVKKYLENGATGAL